MAHQILIKAYQMASLSGRSTVIWPDGPFKIILTMTILSLRRLRAMKTTKPVVWNLGTLQLKLSRVTGFSTIP
jgi:hypothetical protein